MLYVALKGARHDGAAFVGEAVRAGAGVLVSGVGGITSLPGRVSHVEVEDPRAWMAQAACLVYGRPSETIPVIGITGTNGKTSVSYMVRDLLRAAGHRPGLIGTVVYETGDSPEPSGRTTPEAPALQCMLARMVDRGCTCAVMEVSSHALHQARTLGTRFRTAVFTNLTPEHLDYHRTMEEYFEAKTRLFKASGGGPPQTRVIGVDDAWGRKLAEAQPLSSVTRTYGMGASAAIHADRLDLSVKGTRFDCRTPWGQTTVELNRPGRFNVQNALAALAVAGDLGVPLELMAEVLSRLGPVPGRLEGVANDRGLQVYVDYAHTPDALRHALSGLRELTEGRLLLVFGCGGDRDRDKRAPMGRQAARLADYTVLTSDNPRSEDPLAIIRDIEQGFGEAGNYEVQPDRREAIRVLLARAEAGDTLLVAGKGHETYQQFGDTVLPFDDREVVRELLEEEA